MHIYHPTMTLTMTQLYSLNYLIQAKLDQTLSHRVLFHHLRITAMFALISSNRTLKITLDNTIHILIPPCSTSVATPHHIHFYLNPHDRLPYLQHIYILVTSRHTITLLSLPVFRVNALNLRVHGATKCCVQRPMIQISSQLSRSQHTPFITSNPF